MQEMTMDEVEGVSGAGLAYDIGYFLGKLCKDYDIMQAGYAVAV